MRSYRNRKCVLWVVDVPEVFDMTAHVGFDVARDNSIVTHRAVQGEANGNPLVGDVNVFVVGHQIEPVLVAFLVEVCDNITILKYEFYKSKFSVRRLIGSLWADIYFP
jgi:hypothetical protein